MNLLDHQFLSFLIRWVHVGAMAFVLGGAALVFFLAWRVKDSGEPENARTLLFVAENYERVFWFALGLIVATGIGNLGAFGSDLPPTESAWGMKFIVKIALVILLILFSLARTLYVVTLRARANQLQRVVKFARRAYGVTALTLIVILFLAVSLAHG